MTNEDFGSHVGLDRRRSERAALPPFGASVSVVGAQLLNLCSHGALIQSLVPMEVDAVLPFRLVIAGAKQDIRARVIRQQSLPGARRRYRIGLEFVDLPPDVCEQLAHVAFEVLSASVGPP